MDGINLIDWAWEARGSGYANTSVTEDGWQRFRERLLAAERSLHHGVHRLDPGRPQPAATGMITVCMGLGPRPGRDGTVVPAGGNGPTRWTWSGVLGQAGIPEAEVARERSRRCWPSPGSACGPRLRTTHVERELLYCSLRPRAGLDAGQHASSKLFTRSQMVWADVRAAYEPYLAAHPTDRPHPHPLLQASACTAVASGRRPTPTAASARRPLEHGARSRSRTSGSMLQAAWWTKGRRMARVKHD